MTRAPTPREREKLRVHFWATRPHPVGGGFVACDPHLLRNWREICLTAREEEVTCHRCRAWLRRHRPR